MPKKKRFVFEIGQNSILKKFQIIGNFGEQDSIHFSPSVPESLDFKFLGLKPRNRPRNSQADNRPIISDWELLSLDRKKFLGLA